MRGGGGGGGQVAGVGMGAGARSSSFFGAQALKGTPRGPGAAPTPFRLPSPWFTSLTLPGATPHSRPRRHPAPHFGAWCCSEAPPAAAPGSPPACSISSDTDFSSSSMRLPISSTLATMLSLMRWNLRGGGRVWGFGFPMPCAMHACHGCGLWEGLGVFYGGGRGGD